MQVQVLRKFSGSDEVGAVMDATNWPANRAHQLIKRRFLQPIIGEAKRGPGRPRKDEE